MLHPSMTELLKKVNNRYLLVNVTSGLGGYYPANLVIGSVEEILTDDSGLTRYAILAPKTDLSALVEVFVITDFTVVD